MCVRVGEGGGVGVMSDHGNGWSGVRGEKSTTHCVGDANHEVRLSDYGVR